MLYDQTATDKEAILNQHKIAQKQAADIGNQVINDAKINQLRDQLDRARSIGQQEGLAAGQQMYAQINPELQYYTQRAEQDYNDAHQPIRKVPVQEQPTVDHTQFNDVRDAVMNAKAKYDAEHGLAAYNNN